MRVLFVNLVYGVGSTGKIIADIADLLRKGGSDVRILYGAVRIPLMRTPEELREGWNITRTMRCRGLPTTRGCIPGLPPGE